MDTDKEMELSGGPAARLALGGRGKGGVFRVSPRVWEVHMGNFPSAYMRFISIDEAVGTKTRFGA